MMSTCEYEKAWSFEFEEIKRKNDNPEWNKKLTFQAFQIEICLVINKFLHI